MIPFLQNLIDAVSLGSLYALAALGIGLLFGILRLINFAHGDFITIGAYALIVPSTDAVARMFIGGWNFIPLTLAVILVCVAAALLSDRLLFRHLRTANPATLMVASFALGYVIQNLLLMIYGARPKAVGLWSSLTQIVEIGALRVPLLQLIIICVTLALLLGLTLFMTYTRYGVQMRAASEDFVMARYLGIRADFVIALAFAISGMLAALVSLLFITQTGVLSPRIGVSLMIFAFVATVIGGMGSLAGAVIGGFVVGITSAMLQAYLPPDIRPFRDAFVFAIVILILLVRPSGIVRVKALTERV
ncbi:branched-chain amino acid ABC transporter permease [Acuticoccus sp. I52.16.1]|uniref:branched-chain amino acid ABC transporter permease n=1 Tax=Acuticoccus sp. I52.16.1 TaxID=2928472 RepID=UPI001FD3378B|nr:branched-chain amino acid ABC transporter permease [Acuticoccus sp. I52.16.1]UOM35480.1 branched-chain amino acid ABC transporter permease [Acuticoccus sp. I52.16.1]